MDFVSKYVAHRPDEAGYITYAPEEHQVWRMLFERQMKLLPGRACDAFIEGLKLLDLRAEQIPQLPEVSARLKAISAWQVAPVEALISARAFFELLATRTFPAATFIRSQEDLDYVTEPDIFHELFGHCPMLTNPIYADFLYDFASLVLRFPEEDWPLLQRLFWFTVEFGLIQAPEGLRAYGGGILSSVTETVYSVESDVPLRVLFDPVAVFRTPYRIDSLQVLYFVIDDFQRLYDLVLSGLERSLGRARALREFAPLFPVDPLNPNIHILAC